jgi:hypothetical protein
MTAVTRGPVVDLAAALRTREFSSELRDARTKLLRVPLTEDCR